VKGQEAAKERVRQVDTSKAERHTCIAHFPTCVNRFRPSHVTSDSVISYEFVVSSEALSYRLKNMALGETGESGVPGLLLFSVPFTLSTAFHPVPKYQAHPFPLSRPITSCSAVISCGRDFKNTSMLRDVDGEMGEG
jgi:hypothetical protein